MTKISDLHRRWSKDADYKEAYDALGEEFDLARALIEARTAAGLSQSQLARRMKTSQSYIARIEGGKVRPPPTRWSASRRRPARAFGSSSNRSRRAIKPIKSTGRAAAMPSSGFRRSPWRVDLRGGNGRDGRAVAFTASSRTKPRPRRSVGGSQW